MLTVKALRSQVDLWKQYFLDASSEIAHIKTEIAALAETGYSGVPAKTIEQLQQQLGQQTGFIEETVMALELSEDYLLKQDQNVPVNEDYLKEAKALGNQMDAFQKSFTALKGGLHVLMQEK